jgi:hypothetical protein
MPSLVMPLRRIVALPGVQAPKADCGDLPDMFFHGLALADDLRRRMTSHGRTGTDPSTRNGSAQQTPGGS